MSASRMLFIFIIFAMVIGGMLLIVGNMTAQPLGTGSYGTYGGYTNNSTVNRSMQAVSIITGVETSAGTGIMVMIAAIVVILAVLMVVAVIKNKRKYT